MVSYRIIDKSTVRNVVKKAGQLSTAVRVPLAWVGEEVEVKLVNNKK